MRFRGREIPATEFETAKRLESRRLTLTIAHRAHQGQALFVELHRIRRIANRLAHRREIDEDLRFAGAVLDVALQIERARQTGSRLLIFAERDEQPTAIGER